VKADISMPLFGTTGITTVCDKCGAAMVLIGVWPISAEDLEVRMFRCEVCSNSVFYKKKLLPPKEESFFDLWSAEDGSTF
jgi:DNA-directed RNA polymerase subunit RPC12/RpoP